MIGSIGTMELVVILVIALMVFGPRKLPELGRSIGKSLGEFKRASNDLRHTLEDEIHVEEQARRETAKPAPAPAPARANTRDPDPVPNTLGQEFDPEATPASETAAPAPTPAAAPAPTPAAAATDPHQEQPGTV
ncbi:MAG: twin-arginine translocase TatA/TatE family subunit [Acidobacteria bacterium]|nr:twin-arginine translocase TatA/TatE family subunit [Acidobacteriota bacterium]